MPNSIMTSKQFQSLREPGMYADGGGLYLKITRAGTRSWIFRFQLRGKRREMGLGSARAIGLSRARELAQKQREKVAEGIDPVEERKTLSDQPTANKVPTFREAAKAHIARNEDSWSNPKHGKQWTATLETYAYPVIGDLPVDLIETAHLLEILEPIWSSKAETAKRVRGRIEAILDAEKVLGHREAQNPAAWRGHLSLILPPRAKVAPVQHHAALPFGKMPKVFRRMQNHSGFSGLALQFTILTAARSGEVRNALWSEVRDDRWVVPAERMKARREHHVPLSSAAVTVLEIAGKHRYSDYVFPGARLNRPLSDMSLSAVLRRMKLNDITVHGFRSTFRDWAAETTGHPSDVVEMALAHTIPSAVEAAYRRGDLFEKRRLLMNDWADFVTSMLPERGRKSPKRADEPELSRTVPLKRSYLP